MVEPIGQAAAPSRRVALLRGVNLGGARRLPMSALRRVAQGLGWTDVATHLQSGNLLFTAALRDPDASAALRVALREQLGLATDVIVRSAERLRSLIAAHPFADGDPSLVVIACFDRPLDAGVAARLAALAVGAERVQVAEDTVYAAFPGGQASSKLAARLVTAAAPATGTARNLRTVTKLAELLG